MASLVIFFRVFLIFFISSSVAHGSGSAFTKGLSCVHEARPRCTEKQAREICEQKKAICQSLIKSGAIDSKLGPFLVDCDNQATCIVRDTNAMLDGCSKLGIEGWEKVSDHLQKVKTQLQSFEQSCAEVSKGHFDSNYRQCLLKKMPSVHLPDNLDFLFAYFEKRFNTLTDWLHQTKGAITTNINNECERLRDRPDHSFNRCRFTNFMNGLLESLEKPYASSALKSITDLLVEAYVLRVSEHSQSQGCLEPEGVGREFCAMMTVLSTKTVQAALEASDLVPNPKSLAKDVGEELIDQGKDFTKGVVKKDREPTLRRQKGEDLPSDVKKKHLSDVSKSLDEIQRDNARDWVAMTSGPKSPNTGKLLWPRTPRAKKQADELAAMFRDGQKLDFDTKNPVERAKIMDRFKKVAEKYAEIYESQGYQVSIIESPIGNAEQLGGYKLVFEGSSNQKVVDLLGALYDKYNVREFAINVDRNFFENKRGSAAFVAVENPLIELDASGMQDPAQLLKRDILFHEIHHGYYEKAKLEHKNLPYYGFAKLNGTNNDLISLNGYDQTFHAEEIAAYKKQLSIGQSEKMQPTVARDDLKLEIQNKNERTAEVALRYREASRSTLRILDNIEQSMSSSNNYLKNIKYNVRGILEQEPSTATLPLYGANNQKIGEFTIHLVDLNRNEPSNKESLVKAYLQQMKDAATKDYLDAQAKIEFLKQKAQAGQ